MRSMHYHPRVRATALVFISIGTVSRGLAYIDAPKTALTTFVDGLIPLHAWAVVWIVAGVVVLAGIWNRLAARVSCMLAGSLWAVWSASFLLAWIVHLLPWTADGVGATRGWVTGSALLTIAGLVFVVSYLANQADDEKKDEAVVE